MPGPSELSWSSRGRSGPAKYPRGAPRRRRDPSPTATPSEYPRGTPRRRRDPSPTATPANLAKLSKPLAKSGRARRYDDGEEESGVPTSAVRRTAGVDAEADDDDATAEPPPDEPPADDDDHALPLPIHEIFGILAEACAAAGDADAAREHYERAAALALAGEDTSARGGAFLAKAAEL